MLGELRLAVVLLLGACTSGAPPGFAGGSSGDRWTMPLVGPLENGPLITSVTINTHGPYLFLIDPDAPMSIVEASLVKSLELRTFAGPKRLDEADTEQIRIYAELTNLEIGSLIVERRDVFVVRTHAFDTAGRRVVGVLGKDVFADSVAWGFDRDNGLVYMTTQKVFQPPPESTPIIYAELDNRIGNALVLPPPRRLVDATVNGQSYAMHVDLGAPASQLRDSSWEKAKLVPREVKTVVIDDVGEGRLVTKASDPAEVTINGITSKQVSFIPYGDKRWQTQDLEGTIGLDFFRNHDVWQSWHTKQYFVTPRSPVTAAVRVGRWDSAVLSKCKTVGCVTIRVTDPLLGKPVEEGKPVPGLVLSITRDAVAGGMGLEVVLEANPTPSSPDVTAAVVTSPEAGSAAEPVAPTPPSTAPGATTVAQLPRLLINMPGHVDKLLYPLPSSFRGSTLTVVDASPFPRECPSGQGCVDQLAR